MCLLTEAGGVIEFDGLGGVLTSRRDMGLPISPEIWDYLYLLKMCPKRVNT